MDPDRVEVVLFDLGRVVFDYDWTRAFDHWSSCSGLDAATIAGRFTTAGAYERFERGELTPNEYFSILDHQLGTDIGNDEIATGWNAIFGDLIPGMTGLIAAVHDSKYRIAALSNTNAAHAVTFGARYAPVLADLGRILASHELGHRKPEQACYREACARLGVDPAAVLFFDDRADNVAAARRFGIQAVQVHDTGDVRAALSTLAITVPAPG